MSNTVETMKLPVVGKRAAKRLATCTPEEASFSDMEEEEKKDFFSILRTDDNKRTRDKKMTFDQARAHALGMPFSEKPENEIKYETVIPTDKDNDQCLQKLNNSSSGEVGDRRRIKGAPCPDIAFFVEPIQLKSVADSRQWLLSILEHIFEIELVGMKQILINYPKQFSRLEMLCERTKKKAVALKEFDTNFLSPGDDTWFNGGIENPKNAELRKKELELTSLLHNLEEELTEWKCIFDERSGLFNTDTAREEMAIEAEVGMTADVANDMRERNENKNRIMEEAITSQNTVDTAIAQLCFANARLRTVKRVVSQCESLSVKLASICHDKAFQAYAQVNEPRELIKALSRTHVPQTT